MLIDYIQCEIQDDGLQISTLGAILEFPFPDFRFSHKLLSIRSSVRLSIPSLSPEVKTYRMLYTQSNRMFRLRDTEYGTASLNFVVFSTRAFSETTIVWLQALPPLTGSPLVNRTLSNGRRATVSYLVEHGDSEAERFVTTSVTPWFKMDSSLEWWWWWWQRHVLKDWLGERISQPAHASQKPLKDIIRTITSRDKRYGMHSRRK